MCLILRLAGIFTAVDAVCHSVLRAVERRSAERTRSLFICSARALHRLFHPRRADIGNRRKKKTQKCQPPVVHQKHDRVADQCHTGIEHLRRKLAHALDTVVHVGDCPGQQLARARFFEFGPAASDQIGIQHALHPAVDVVGKAADIETLDKPRRLHCQCDENVEKHQHRHACSARVSAQNVCQPLCQLPLKPRRGKEPDVVEKPGERHEDQGQKLGAEVGENPVRAKVVILLHRLRPSRLRL